MRLYLHLLNVQNARGLTENLKKTPSFKNPTITIRKQRNYIGLDKKNRQNLVQ